MLALLLAVNVLAVALPGRSFEDARADEAKEYKSIASLFFTPGKSAKLSVTVGDESLCYIKAPNGDSIKPDDPPSSSSESSGSGNTYNFTLNKTADGTYFVMAEDGAPVTTLAAAGSVLERAELYGPELTSVNVSGNPNLSSIATDKTKAPKLTSLDCANCALDFYNLSLIKSNLPDTATMTATPQTVSIPTHAKADTELDVSPYRSSDTTVQWKKAADDSDIATSPTYTLTADPSKVYAELTDPAFPDVTVKTNTCSFIYEDTLFYYHTAKAPVVSLKTQIVFLHPATADEDGYVVVRKSDLEMNSNFTSIEIGNTDVTDFQLLADAADYPNLKTITIYGGDIGTLDLSNSAAALNLDICNCGVRKIYLSNAADTATIDISGNPAPVIVNGVDRTAATPVKRKITSLDIGRCGYTGEFDATEYCVTDTLNASNNELTSVKLKDTLTTVNLSNNKLTTLDIPDAAGIINLNISNNNFTFATLPVTTKVSGTYIYYPQAEYVVEPSNYYEEETVNLSGAGATGYTWYEYNKETETKGAALDPQPTQSPADSGKFLLPAGTAICEMTDPTRFPGLTITTTPVTCSTYTGSTPPHKAAIAYNGSTGKLKAETDRDIFIDWGDDEPKRVTPGEGGVIEGEITKNADNKYLIQVYTFGDLTKLDVKDSNVVALNIEHCTELEELDCSNSADTTSANTISLLDVSKCANLKKLNCENNQIANTGLTLPTDGGKITDLDCSGNKLRYDGLPAEVAKIKAKEGATLDCSGQDPIDSITSIPAGGIIDLSSQATYAGKDTEYNWFTVDGDPKTETPINEGITPDTTTKGKFTVGSSLVDKTIICRMTNDNAPDLISTGPIKVNPTASTKQAAEIKIDKGAEFDIYVKSNKPVYIDYGNGTIEANAVTKGDGTEEKISGTAAGSSIKLYTDGDLTYLKVNNEKVSGVDASPSTKLDELDISGCSIKALDTSKNTELKTLDCADNGLTSLDTSKNTKLENLDCSKNDLTSLKIPESLKTLDCSDNALDYSTLPEEAADLGSGKFTVEPQDTYTTGIPAAKAVGKELDLSSQKSYDGTDTVYTWYKTDGTTDTKLTKDTDYTESNGKFTFKDTLKDANVYAVMTNTKAPDLNLKTSTFKITDGGEWFINDGAKVLATNTPVLASKDSSCKDSSGNLIPISDLEPKNTKSDKTKLQLITSTVTDAAVQKSMLDQIKAKNTAFKDSYKQYILCDISLKSPDGTNPVTDLNGKIAIKFKVPDSVKSSDDMTYYVYHHDMTKNTAELIYTGKGGSDGITFEADSFSPYSLVWLTPRQISDAGNTSSDPGSDPSSNSSSNPSSNSSSNSSGNTSSNTPAPSTGDKNSSTNNAPKTGEDAKASSAAWAIMFLSLLIISALGVSGVVLYRKRKIVEESLNRDR